METEQITIRTAAPGDQAFEAVGDLHAELYGVEHGFGEDFASLVYKGLLALEAALPDDPEAGRLWVVENDGSVRGAIGVTRESPSHARLRWFLLDPALRGHGTGRELVRRVVDYSREHGFASISLTTIPQLTTAAHLYREAGFVRVEERPHSPWGGAGVTEIYELRLP